MQIPQHWTHQDNMLKREFRFADFSAAFAFMTAHQSLGVCTRYFRTVRKVERCWIGVRLLLLSACAFAKLRAGLSHTKEQLDA